ncbi:PIG-X [Dendryphion nanum]|uniref:Protein PBN1 n=1 Tax=Dendryphion nanum TaxID=256645 RepID=A0A9P9IJD4_9PLEO|nr:PIG-X [Dendryphion nanum]
MKQRITYIVPNPDDYNPETIEVTSNSFTLQNVKAVKEHRITFGLSELPTEVYNIKSHSFSRVPSRHQSILLTTTQLRKALEQWHELHIRWATDQPYKTIPPFTSRISPGLHVFFTPQKSQQSDDPLCTLLTTIFGPIPKCTTPSESFTKLPTLSERFTHSASSQFYALVPSLTHLVQHLQSQLCAPTSPACKIGAQSLLTASSLDIDYDAISHALVVNAFWSEAPGKEGWSETVLQSKKKETVEIGVLNRERNTDPEDLQFAGFLVVLGVDGKPKPTLFQAPARHYPLPLSSSSPSLQTYTTTFRHPTGLHPTLLLTLSPSTLSPPDATCKLHAHLTLPSHLFIDKYQFSDPLFLSSHHLASLRSLSGATDLEAPDWTVAQWGSAALFEIAVPEDADEEPRGKVTAGFNVSIPLHLRYMPAANSSHTRVPLPWPVIFWACRAEDGTKMNVNPFDRVHLGYEGLFGPRTRFMHVSPKVEEGRELVEYVDVPVLDLRKAAWVEWGTVGTVVLAFLGLCWVLFRPLGRREEEEAKSGKNEKDGKKKQ